MSTLPTRQEALAELDIASGMNPGPWTGHSRHVAMAAERIARCCPGLEPDRAFVLGLLHDIGRRTGVSAMRHVIDGYDYAMSRGWEAAARVCLTHSFPVRDANADIARRDVTEEQYDFISRYLAGIEYDDYDKLIILCDALGDAKGFCILEKRFVDTARRYGIFPFTLDRWNATFAYKSYFEDLMGRSVYAVLPGIERCVFT